MSEPARDEWMPVLSRLNSILLRSDERRNDVTEEARASGWCGSPPASEKEILVAEQRLGVTLPLSYRSFLLISNGWRPFGDFIECLLPARGIEYFHISDPSKLEALQSYYSSDAVSDDEYVDYEAPECMSAMRLGYYAGSILVGKGWGVEDDMVLLNPRIISAEGEWETIFFANWIPGNRRYRSFFHYVRETVNRLEML